jgi:hypothetical protein
MRQGVSLQRNCEAVVSLAGPELQPVEGGTHGMGGVGEGNLSYLDLVAVDCRNEWDLQAREIKNACRCSTGGIPGA